METSSLNQAHQQHRRAEALLKYKKFDEAIDCHKRAAELLEEAIKLTDNARSIESLKLQKDYHLRQRNIILVKKEQFENSKNAQENHKNKLSSTYENNHNLINENVTIQDKILQTFEETDSLLHLLQKKGSSGNSDSESSKSYDERALSYDLIDTPNSNIFLGTKHPKDDATIIEELRTLNEKLLDLIRDLFAQLEENKIEISRLKERIKQLEEEKSKGGTSPYVFSPCSELSPDVHEARVLPPLAPLEIPNFDFSNFVKNNAHPVGSSNS